MRGGECRVFEAPKYVVLGKRAYDQDWIDGNIEGGVGGCGWKRPAARPASFDAVPGQKIVAAAPKKKALFKRIGDRLSVKKAPVPFVESSSLPLPPVPPVVVVPEPVKPVPVDPVDALLHPKPR